MSAVTAPGIRYRGMRLLVHRGQVLLLLVVGVLAGVAVAAVGLEMGGVSLPGVLRVNQLVPPAHTQIPSRIVIGAPLAPSNDSGLGGASAASAAPAVVPTGSHDAAKPSPTTSVVPGNVYVYPPDDRGRGGPSPGSGDGHSGRGGG